MRLRFVRVFGQERVGAQEKLGAVDFLLLHLLPPSLDNGLGGLAPMGHRLRQQRHDEVAAFDRRIGNRSGLKIPHGAGHGGRQLTRIVVDHGFQIARQPIMDVPVHRQHVSPAARRRIGEFGVRSQQVVQSQRWHDMPRVDAGIDNVLGDGVRKLRAWHENRVGAELTHGLAHETRLHVDLEVLDVLDRAYRPRGMHDRAIGTREAKRVHLAKFVFEVDRSEIGKRF